MTLFRKALFYLFCLAFVIGAPLIVLYALGYIVRPIQSGGIVQTGLIYLSSTPPGATAYLQKKRYREKTPTILRDLLPGEYSLRLALKHYRVWNRDVRVEAGKATVLDRILLIPGALKPVRYTEESFEELIPVSGTGFVLLKKGQLAKDLFVFDSSASKLLPVFSRQFHYPDARVSRIDLVPSSPHVVVYLKLGKDSRIYGVELSARETKFRILDDFFDAAPGKLKWDPKTAQHYFAFKNNRLTEVRTVSRRNNTVFSFVSATDSGENGRQNEAIDDSRASDARGADTDFLKKSFLSAFEGELSPPVRYEQVRGYGVSEDAVYVLSQNQILRKRLRHGESEALLKDEPLFLKLFGKKGFYDVYAFSPDRIFFVGDNGKFIGTRPPYFLTEARVAGLDYEEESGKILIWNGRQIGVVDLADRQKEKFLFENYPRVRWFFEGGKRIKRAFWIYDDSHVLFLDGNTVYLFELWLGENARVEELISVAKNSDVAYVEEAGYLYYLDAETQRFCGLEILPKKQIPVLSWAELAVQRTLRPEERAIARESN